MSDSEWTLRTGESDEDISGLNGERTALGTLDETAHDGTAVTVTIESVDTGEETLPAVRLLGTGWNALHPDHPHRGRNRF